MRSESDAQNRGALVYNIDRKITIGLKSASRQS